MEKCKHPDMMLGDRLRKARKAANSISQERLAEDVGMSRVTITQIESGQVKTIEGNNLLAVCKRLDIRPEWLLHGNGPMHTNQADAQTEAREPSTEYIASAVSEQALEVLNLLPEGDQRRALQAMQGALAHVAITIRMDPAMLRLIVHVLVKQTNADPSLSDLEKKQKMAGYRKLTISNAVYHADLLKAGNEG